MLEWERVAWENRHRMSGVAEQAGQRRRAAWVDAARVLGIFFICQVHSAAAPGNLVASAGALCMFFVLAGYFNAGKELKASLLRSLLFIAAYSFWSIMENGLSREGVDFSIGSMAHSLVYAPFSMWFIKYLAVLLPLGSLISRLPQWVKLVLAAVLLACTYTVEPVLETVPLTCERMVSVNNYPSYVLFLYLCGDVLRVVSLPELPGRLFPVLWRHRRCAMLCSGLMLAAMVAASHCTTVNFQEPVLLLGVAWLLLFFSHSLSGNFPRLTACAAAVGPAVFLVYMSNALVIRVFTSAYIRCFGDYPGATLCNLFCVGFIIACAVAYRLMAGRSRILDAVLFAR